MNKKVLIIIVTIIIIVAGGIGAGVYYFTSSSTSKRKLEETPSSPPITPKGDSSSTSSDTPVVKKKKKTTTTTVEEEEPTLITPETPLTPITTGSGGGKTTLGTASTSGGSGTTSTSSGSGSLGGSLGGGGNKVSVSSLGGSGTFGTTTTNTTTGDGGGNNNLPEGISQMVDCKNATNLSMFCALPDLFIEKCNNVSPQNYSASLEQCLINYSTLLKKENYEKAVKLLNYPSNLPATLPTVDCKLQEDQNAFCQKPDEFVDSCLLQTKVSPKDTYYANKMKECAITTNMGLTKEVLEDRKRRYNKAKAKLEELFPNTKIVNFSNVDCTKEEALFCNFPDDYVEGCYDATLPRKPTSQQITSQNNMYAAKIDNCIKKNRPQMLDKKKFSRAKDLLLDKDPSLKILDVPSSDCKLENQLSYFCMTPDTYITDCKPVNNTSNETYTSQLLQCLKKEKNRMTEDSYLNALMLLNNPSELPKEFPTIDWKKLGENYGIFR